MNEILDACRRESQQHVDAIWDAMLRANALRGRPVSAKVNGGRQPRTPVYLRTRRGNPLSTDEVGA